jgi:hypothetical protein
LPWDRGPADMLVGVIGVSYLEEMNYNIQVSVETFTTDDIVFMDKYDININTAFQEILIGAHNMFLE